MKLSHYTSKEFSQYIYSTESADSCSSREQLKSYIRSKSVGYWGIAGDLSGVEGQLVMLYLVK